jgi:hypothetical protein
MKRHLLIFLILLAAGTAMSQSHVSDLVVTPAFSGGTIKWYDASTGGTQYTNPAITILVDGTTYYASQTVNGVESTARLAVTATAIPLPTPTFTAQPGTTACLNTDVTYTTQSGMTGYVWTFTGTLTTDYTITSGGTINDYTVTLKWVTTGSRTVTINYTNANSCTAASATSSTASNVATLCIGAVYQGGKVAYIFLSGDPGFVSGETHGLIAAASDQSSSATWWNGSNTSTGATATALGTGSENTTAIISSQGNTGSYAAKLCMDYAGGGYNDWYLPSKDELNKLWVNRVAIGGFAVLSDYWSSSEIDLSKATVIFFTGSYEPGDLGKENLRYVRAIRTF